MYSSKHEKSCDQDFTRQCNYINHVRWANYILPYCKFPVVYICQKYENLFSADKVIAVIERVTFLLDHSGYLHATQLQTS